MGKHLLCLKARTKGKLADGLPTGGRGRLTEDKIKKLQNYYSLAIRQNTVKTPNRTRRDVGVAVYSMKNIIAILHHSVKSEVFRIWKRLADYHYFSRQLDSLQLMKCILFPLGSSKVLPASTFTVIE